MYTFGNKLLSITRVYELYPLFSGSLAGRNLLILILGCMLFLAIVVGWGTAAYKTIFSAGVCMLVIIIMILWLLPL